MVYIHDLLAYTESHEKHLLIRDQVLARLHKNHLKINLDNVYLATKEVSYLGFTLMPEGIKPSKSKQKLSRTPNHLQYENNEIFCWLVQLLQNTHKDFALIVDPLVKLTRKDSGYKLGPLPEEAK
jgi:hypothetical protein